MSVGASLFIEEGESVYIHKTAQFSPNQHRTEFMGMKRHETDVKNVETDKNGFHVRIIRLRSGSGSRSGV